MVGEPMKETLVVAELVLNWDTSLTRPTRIYISNGMSRFSLVQNMPAGGTHRMFLGPFLQLGTPCSSLYQSWTSSHV